MRYQNKLINLKRVPFATIIIREREMFEIASTLIKQQITRSTSSHSRIL